jgi:hypothetical protein
MPSEDLEGPSGNGQGQGGSREAITCYDHVAGVATTIFTGCGPRQALKVR